MSTGIVNSSNEKLEEAIALLRDGKLSPKDMLEAGKEMDRLREETRKQVGTVELAVELIRDARQ